jgi:hypothetical protein
MHDLPGCATARCFYSFSHSNQMVLSYLATHLRTCRAIAVLPALVNSHWWKADTNEMFSFPYCTFGGSPDEVMPRCPKFLSYRCRTFGGLQAPPMNDSRHVCPAISNWSILWSSPLNAVLRRPEMQELQSKTHNSNPLLGEVALYYHDVVSLNYCTSKDY